MSSSEPPGIGEPPAPQPSPSNTGPTAQQQATPLVPLAVNAAIPAGRFRTVGRSIVDASGPFVTIKQDQRHTLSATDLEKLHKAAVTALPATFDLLSHADGNKQLDNTYNVVMRVSKASARIRLYNMEDVFLILFPNPSTPGQFTKNPQNLLTNYGTLSLANVWASVRFIRLFGQDYNLQNLEWSCKFLEASCSTALANKINKALLKVPDIEKGGPTYFLYMLTTITSLTKDATNALVT